MFNGQTMRIKSSGTLLGALAALGLVSGCTTFGEGQKCGAAGCSADARIASRVQTSLDGHPEFGPAGQLQVASLNRVVYLYGSVANDLQLAMANSIASQAIGDVRGVSSIVVSEK